MNSIEKERILGIMESVKPRFDVLVIAGEALHHNTNGALMGVDLKRRQYRESIVETWKDSLYINRYSGCGREKLHKEESFGRLIESAFNTSLNMITADDLDDFAEYINIRAEAIGFINDITLGDVMTIIAVKLAEKFGGSPKYWLFYMFERMGLYKKRADMGMIMLDCIKYLYFSDIGYGVLGVKNVSITRKKVGFMKQCDIYIAQFPFENF